MGWFDSHEDSFNQYNDTRHQASTSHELIAGAAAYEAAKAYENHREANGNPVSHARAKELLAGFAGAFIDREAETRGADAFDAYQAKRQANQQIDNTFTEDVYQQY